MSITLDDDAIRAQLHSDLNAAWPGLKSVNDDPPFLPASSADLPQAFVQIGKFAFTYGGGTAGMSQVSTPHVYTITGVFTWPTTGTIEAAKLAKGQALLTQLTQSAIYAGWRYKLVSLDFNETVTSPSEPGNQEPIYQVILVISVEVLSSV